MSIVAKALWAIENRYAQPALTLDAIAEACGASRFHLTRAFGVTTGRSLMRYLRARRMTQAALALAAGAPDILAVALDAGYGSHEAFIPAQRYAVFFHGGHIASIRSTWRAIFDHALPAAGLQPTGGPEFERYDERFDPHTGNGGVDIWIPISPT